MRIFRYDVRLAARSFARHPGFTVVAVLSLALGIALNTTMYSVIDALVRPKIDMQDPGRLYRLKIWGDTKHVVDQTTRASLLRTGFDTYESTTFEFGVGVGQLAVEYRNRFQMASGQAVAPNFFQVLGVRPMAGRTFADADATAETAPIIIGDRLAAALFPDGASPMGEVIDVDGEPHPIVGVIGQASQFPGEHNDIWMLPPPGTIISAIPPNIIRLRKGVPAAVADQQLHVLSARFAAVAGELSKDAWFQLIPATVPQFHYRGFHVALIAAVVAVLLIACANLANLQLARGIGRRRELALRTALGAERRDIIGQLVLESALLTGAGLVLGLLLTFWGGHILSSRIPPSVAEYVIAPQTSWRVLVFAIVACALCVMLVGLLPAIRVSRVDPNELLKAGAGTGATRKSRQQYGVLVAVEIALSLALLSGAGVVVQSAIAVSTRTPGYNLTPLSAAWILFRAPHDTTVRYVDLSTQLVSRMRSLPDVADATVYFMRQTSNHSVTVYADNGSLRQIPTPLYGYRIVSPSYLRTFHLSLASGRDFLEGTPGESEIIIDQQTARFLWPGAEAVGKQLKLGDGASNVSWVRVVGVLRPGNELSKLDVYSQATSGEAPPERATRLGTIYYLPGARDTIRLTTRTWAFFVVARAKAEPERMPITLKRNLQRMAPLSLLEAERMDVFLGLRRIRESHDFVAATFVMFALMALALASLGVFGIVVHSVAERRRELGVRLALGATKGHIVHVVLREGNALALAGIAAGLVLSRYSVPLLVAFSHYDDKYDAPLFAVMALLLFAVAALSALVPALRAARIDPVESLRSE